MKSMRYLPVVGTKTGRLLAPLNAGDVAAAVVGVGRQIVPAEHEIFREYIFIIKCS